MSKPVYTVLDLFLQLRPLLRTYSDRDQATVNEALQALAVRPLNPEGFTVKKLKSAGFYKIEIPLEKDYLSVTYELRPVAQEIRIAEVREAGALRKARGWIGGLFFDIAPKQD